VLLMVAYNSSMLDLFNREMIVVECLQSLVGSLGILMTLPFTSFICALLFRGGESGVNNQQNVLPAEEDIDR
ncbi:MAG: YibE/F family protein, partial [Peptococcaceae bacterium]|nr:YibE/F family protein [Peptococcaceae bacterium]